MYVAVLISGSGVVSPCGQPVLPHACEAEAVDPFSFQLFYMAVWETE